MAGVRRTWRSWFWNLVLAAIYGTFLIIAVSVAFSATDIGSKVLMSVIGVYSLAGTVLSLSRRVVARPDGIYMRQSIRRTWIPWDAVERVECERSESGLLPTYAPVVWLSRTIDTATVADVGGAGAVELSVLSSYLPGGPRRATDGLNAALRAVRARS